MLEHGELENHAHVNAYVDTTWAAVGIATGGNITRVAAKTTTFTYPDTDRVPETLPAELVEFASAGRCLVAATGNAAKLEACLDDIGPAAYPPPAPPTPTPPPPISKLNHAVSAGDGNATSSDSAAVTCHTGGTEFGLAATVAAIVMTAMAKT